MISDRVSHPFFVRTISTSSKGASHDPIDVEHNARSGPRKLVFASDQKPAHSFFSASDEATVLPEIPFKGKARNVNDFFVGDMTAAEHSAVVKTGWGGGVREGEEWMAPWPGGDWPSHEGAAGPSKALPSLMKKRKSRQVPRSIDSDRTDRWSSFLKHESAPDEPGHPPSRCPQPNSTSNLCDIIDAFKAFRRKKVVGDRETWSERYRPHRAEEILGNKAEAIYLRDWLLALQVGGGRKVVRKVNRSKRQLVEGWIVDDIVLFGDVNDDEGEEDQAEDLEEPESPLGGRPDDYPPLTTRLTNIILLTGPHGSGKSAAVYAAADELGWEVFEVYPGVGKRTGANLMSLVGDVGKNHMVVNGGGKIELEEKGHITSFLKRPKDAEVSSGKASQRSTTVTIEAQQEGHNEFEEREVRQSLILIDEVDILFAEEYTFWPAVVALIADSHRPVILTCNGETSQPTLSYLTLTPHRSAASTTSSVTAPGNITLSTTIIVPCRTVPRSDC